MSTFFNNSSSVIGEVESFNLSGAPVPITNVYLVVSGQNIPIDSLPTGIGYTIKLEGYNFLTTNAVYLSSSTYSSFNYYLSNNDYFGDYESVDIYKSVQSLSAYFPSFSAFAYNNYTIFSDNVLNIDLPPVETTTNFYIIIANDGGYSKTNPLAFETPLPTPTPTPTPVKNLTNISWDFSNIPITGFAPFPSNENDRPRINVFRSDTTNITYMSAGWAVLSAGKTYYPWGDRSIGSYLSEIPLTPGLSAGVDIFLPTTGLDIVYIIPPLNQWTATINGDEIKYQKYFDNINSLNNVAISIRYLTPSPTVTPTFTPTPTKTSTNTPTPTITKTQTGTPDVTVTPAKTQTPTQTCTPTPTNTITNTPTNTITNTQTLTPDVTITPTKTCTPTNTPTPTNTLTKTCTPSNTPTKTAAVTPTNTASCTRTPSVTPTSTPSYTPTNTVTPTVTKTPGDGFAPVLIKNAQNSQNFNINIGTNRYSVFTFAFSTFDAPDNFAFVYDGQEIPFIVHPDPIGPSETGFRGNSAYNSQLNALGYPDVVGGPFGYINVYKPEGTSWYITVSAICPLKDSTYDLYIYDRIILPVTPTQTPTSPVTPTPTITPTVTPTMRNADISINWNMTNVVITGYPPYPSNELDRPRINTFRSDGNFVIYMSAGAQVLFPPVPPNSITSPWGNRNISQQNVKIPLQPEGYTCGVDLFTDQNIGIVSIAPPLAQWTVEPTINPGELKYQITFSSPGFYEIGIGLRQPVPSPTPTNTPTQTITPTNTNTSTPTSTPSNTPTNTITPTQTITPTKTSTSTPTSTPTPTVTQTPFTPIRIEGGQGVSSYPIFIGYTTPVLVTIKFNTFDVPDLFEFSYEGSSIYNTGFRGSSSYNAALNALGYSNVSGPGEDEVVFLRPFGGSSQYMTLNVTAPLNDSTWYMEIEAREIFLPTPTPTQSPTVTPTPTQFFNIGDNAGLYGPEWLNGSNQGQGFQAWNLYTNLLPTGSGGFFIGNPSLPEFGYSGVGSAAWGLTAYGNSPGGFINAERLLSSPLTVNKELSVQIAANYRNGNKGIDIYVNNGFTNNDKIFNFNIGNNEYYFNNTQLPALLWPYIPNSVFELRIQQLSNSILAILTRNNYLTAVELPAAPNGAIVTGLKLYCGDTDNTDIPKNALLINNLAIAAPRVTPTPTNTVTQTQTPSVTPTQTITPTNTLTPNSTPTPTNTITPSVTPTNTITPSVTPTNTITPTNTPTNTITNTQSPTPTPTLTVSPTTLVGFDVGSNYAIWTDGSNGGYGFEPWELTESGDPLSAGFFLNNPFSLSMGNIGATSFGLSGKSGTNYANAYRYILTPLPINKKFAVTITTAYRNGNKGMNFVDPGGNSLWNLNVGNNEYYVNGFATGWTYRQTKVFTVSAENLGSNTYNITVNAGYTDLGGSLINETLSSGQLTFGNYIDGVQLYCGQTDLAEQPLDNLFFNTLIYN